MAGVQAIFDRYGRPLNTFIVSCRTAPHPNSPVSTAQQAPGLLLPPPTPPFLPGITTTTTGAGHPISKTQHYPQVL